MNGRPRPRRDDDGATDASGFTHLDARGRARMVDVTAKPETRRRALARCVVRGDPDALAQAVENGDALECARAAGTLWAKSTSGLIPLCHPLPLDTVELAFEVGHDSVVVRAETLVLARTGVEMEALSASAAAGLALLVQVLPADPAATMSTLALWHKSGGRSGVWERAGT